MSRKCKLQNRYRSLWLADKGDGRRKPELAAQLAGEDSPTADINSSHTNPEIRRTRRVKCDEQKPVCKRCTIADVPCDGLGYSIAIRDPSKPVALAPKPSARTRSIARAPPPVPQLNGSSDIRDLLDLIPQMDKYINESFVENPANAVTEYVLFRGGQLTMYVEFLPSRLGYNSSLDRAITCVAGALRDICLPADCRSSVNTLSNYSRALNVLQRSLSDAAERLSAEVLCAIHLLGIFEVSFTSRPKVYTLF